MAICLWFTQCGPKKANNHTHEDGKANHLIDESSPYLLQHAYNPVHWYPWGEEALDKAKSENKLLLISIGYAACHWCHVMEHESFEDTAVAQTMNSSFVNIKVDREERPDIDDIYMTACQMANGRGCGWPLNCFALPDGRPVWAGTYFPKDEWTKILDYFQNLYQTDPAKLEEYATQLTEGIQTMDIIPSSEDGFTAEKDKLEKMAEDFVSRMDLEKGGREGAPKFPMPNGISFLLRAQKGTAVSSAGKAAFTTLDQMAAGGIYDHLAGGFARYSVDDVWLVPHFEKMLYDNGQLLTAYAEAYKIDPKPRYAEIMDQTIGFLQRELMNDKGGFYSSLDADSEGEEGKFYVWTKEEISQVITNHQQLDWFLEYYNITDAGNWEEHKNILHTKQEISALANYEKGVTEKSIAEARAQLFTIRSNRVRPGLDDKVLCSWNALALKGVIDAYTATGDPSYKELALKNANFLATTFIQSDFRLQRNYKDGKTAINAFLDDYALLAEAFIQLYQITFDEKWLDKAKGLVEYAQSHFFDEKSGFYFYTNNIDPALIARKKELADNVIPGSNSTMARVLFKLGILMDQTKWQERAERMMAAIQTAYLDDGQTNFYSNWANLYYEMVYRPYEIAILGPEALSLSLEFQKSFHPDALFLGGSTEGSLTLLENKLQEGRDMIYVCQNRVCKFPVSTVAEAKKLL